MSNSSLKNIFILVLTLVVTNNSVHATVFSDENTKIVKTYAVSVMSGIVGHGALELARYLFHGNDQWYSLGRWEALMALSAKCIAIKSCNLAFNDYLDIETDETISWITGAGIFTIKEIASY